MYFILILVLISVISSSSNAFLVSEEDGAYREDILRTILERLQVKDNENTLSNPFSMGNVNYYSGSVNPFREDFVDEKIKKSFLYRINKPTIRLRETRLAQFGRTMNPPKQAEKIFPKLLRYG